jgi:enoyl-CoA hydratase
VSAVLYQVRDGIAYVTLNRPEVHNAMDPRMVVELAEAWLRFEAEEGARVAIITGAGEKAFSAGADLKRLIPLITRARQPEDEWDRRVLEERVDGVRLLDVALMRLRPLFKPVIAAINGYCLAGGTELALACDLRVAAEHATLGLTEPKRGLIPGGGSLVRLPRQVPYCKAMEILLTGEPISAQEAWRIGLVNHVVPLERLMPTAEGLARSIAENGPLAVRKIKEVVVRASGLPLEQAYQVENEASRVIMRSEDAREGARAFAEKRKPRFTGR